MINHFIGFGGGGSNILQTLFKEIPNGKFTMVSDPIREFLTESM
jgi:cell division GTPase FtsZ